MSFAPRVVEPGGGPSEARESAPTFHQRVSAVDHLRGLVMVIMVLDHTREFFMNYRIDPTNLAQTTLPFFFTRWITHFCAPVFVFLAGTGAFLAYARGKNRARLAVFMATRGLWLMVLEVTLVKLGWFFHLDYSFVLLQVIWTIGAAMILLAGLIFLPISAIALIGFVIVLGHNLLDGQFQGALANLGSASVLIRPGALNPRPGMTVGFAYPLIPWLGVMLLGYAFGPVLTLPHHRGRRLTFALGLIFSVAFVALRWLNVYGDPVPWTHQASASLTFISFLNCQKYPPSLLYLLMTLGPALMLLSWFQGETGTGPVRRWLVDLGRVPLFFYLLQWPIVHLLAIVFALARGESIAWFFKHAPFSPPPDYGHSLGTVYLMWVVAILLLIFPCRWFANLKRRRRDAWLSYL